MKNWSADFTNDPKDDYNIIVEVLRGEEEIAVIRRNGNNLEMEWYPGEDMITVPVDWMINLLIEAAKRL